MGRSRESLSQNAVQGRVQLVVPSRQGRSLLRLHVAASLAVACAAEV